MIAERVHVIYDLMKESDCEAAGAELERVFFGVTGASGPLAAPSACNEPMLIILKRRGANLGLTSQGLPLNPCQDLPQRNLCVLMRQ